MKKVGLRYLLCYKAPIPLTNPYDPCTAGFYKQTFLSEDISGLSPGESYVFIL